jgi:hypothetical protein
MSRQAGGGAGRRISYSISIEKSIRRGKSRQRKLPTPCFKVYGFSAALVRSDPFPLLSGKEPCVHS